jgi:hypothetical protein
VRKKNYENGRLDIKRHSRLVPSYDGFVSSGDLRTGVADGAQGDFESNRCYLYDKTIGAPCG